MKKVMFLATLVAFVSLWISCRDIDNPINPQAADFDLKFTAKYDGVQLEKYKDYDYGGYPLQIYRFTLYLSDITLLNGTEETPVSDIDYLDFTPSDASSDLTAQPVLNLKNVPWGTYTGIRMGYGVKPSLNAKQPSDFAAGTPLARDEEYWLGWKSYIFCKIEGAGDKDNNGQQDHFLIYHCGGDGVYKTFAFNQPIQVDDTNKELNIDFDLKDVFTQPNGNLYNLVANPATSNFKDSLRIANDVMNGFEAGTRAYQ